MERKNYTSNQLNFYIRVYICFQYYGPFHTLQYKCNMTYLSLGENFEKSFIGKLSESRRNGRNIFTIYWTRDILVVFKILDILLKEKKNLH